MLQAKFSYWLFVSYCICYADELLGSSSFAWDRTITNGDEGTYAGYSPHPSREGVSPKCVQSTNDWLAGTGTSVQWRQPVIALAPPLKSQPFLAFLLYDNNVRGFYNTQCQRSKELSMFFSSFDDYFFLLLFPSSKKKTMSGRLH